VSIPVTLTIQEPLRDRAGRAIFENTPGKMDWYSLSEERREPWRKDADLVLEMAGYANLVAAMNAVAIALDVPRNRFGKLDGDMASAEPLRKLAVEWNTAPAKDTAEQAVNVLCAALAKARGETP